MIWQNQWKICERPDLFREITFQKLLAASDFRKKVFIEEQKAQNEDRFLRGRQIAFMIYDYFRITSKDESILDFCDLMGISLRGDNVEGFDTKWDQVFLSMKRVPEDGILENIFKIRLRDSEQLMSTVAL